MGRYSQSEHTPEEGHIPPDLVVGSITRSSKASRGEDLQVEHPGARR